MKLDAFLKLVGGVEERITVLTGKKALESVKQIGDALKYVKEQSEAVCLEAVKQNGYALRYVKEQSEAVCLEAVKQNGNVLRYVDKNIFEK